MTDAVGLREWLDDWRRLNAADVKQYSCELLQDASVIAALLQLFTCSTGPHELLEPCCGQLLAYYRSREPSLVHFCLQLVPTLVYTHLHSVATRSRTSYRPVETLLLGLYNLEVIDNNGQPRTSSFRMPTLIKQSVYHEPLHLAPASLTEHSLSRLKLGDNFSVDWGPLSQISCVQACNRQTVVSTLISVYAAHLSFFSDTSLQGCAQAVTRICGQGFPVPSLSAPRLAVSSELLLELVHVVYFIMHAGGDAGLSAHSAFKALVTRARYHVYADVMAAVNAIQNSLAVSPSTGDSAITSTEKSSSFSTSSKKSIITNASFRTRKLPDDIPIRRGAGGAAGSEANSRLEHLTSISEQLDADDASCSSPPNSAVPAFEAAPSTSTATTSSAAHTVGVRLRLRERKTRSSSGSGSTSAPDKHVTTVLSALPGLKRRVERKRMASSENASAAGPIDGGSVAAPLARIDCIELRVVSSGSEAGGVTPQSTRRSAPPAGCVGADASSLDGSECSDGSTAVLSGSRRVGFHQPPSVSMARSTDV